MGNLTNKYIKDTYDGLIKLQDSTQGVQPTTQPLQDGLGNNIPAEVSTTEFNITGTSTNAVSASYAVTASYAENVPSSSNIYVSGVTFYSSSIVEPGGQPGELVLRRTEGEPDLVTDLDGRYQTLAAAQNEDLRIQFLEYDVDLLNSQTGSYLITGSAVGNVITMEKQDGTTFPITVTVDPADLPSGLISGSDQVILQDTTGNLSGSRISGPVSDSVNSVSASYAANGGVTSIIAGTNVTIDQSTGDVTINASGGGGIPVGGEQYQQLTTDGAGTLTWDFSTKTVLNIKNVDTVPLTIGMAVHVVGVQGAELYQVERADYNDPAKMPAIGLIKEDSIAVNGQGHAIMVGDIKGYNTQAAGWSINDPLYVDGAGVLTNTRPTGSGLVQKIANVGSVANNGQIVVVGAGRSNDLPNIPTDNIWVGDINGVPQAVESTGYLSGSFALLNGGNTFSGNQTINGNLGLNGDGINNQVLVVNEQTGTSGSIGMFLNNFGGSSQPTLFFGGDNAYFQSNGNFTIENSPGGGGTGSIQITTNGDIGLNTNGTGSQNINLNSATGEINATSQNVNINDEFPRFRFNAGFGGDRHLLDINQMTAFYSGFPAITQTNFGIQRTNQQYNGLVAEFWDSPSFNWGADFAIGPNGVYAEVIGSGSGQVGEINVNANSIGVTYATVTATNVDIGNSSATSTLDLGYVGPGTGITKLAGNEVFVGSNFGFTDQITIDATTFIKLDSPQIDITGSVNISGSTTHTGDHTVTGNENIQGTLNVTGQTTTQSDVIVTGSVTAVNFVSAGQGINTSLGSNNSLGGITTIPSSVPDSELRVNGIFKGTGVSSFESGLQVTGSLNVEGGGVGLNTATNTINVIGGNTTFDGGGQLNVNGRFETTGETLLSNGAVVTGSLNVSGSMNLIQGKPAVGTQANILDIEGQLGYYSGFPPMTQTNWGLQSYSSQQYNGLVTELWDSPSFNWGVDHAISANGVWSEVIASGSGAVAEHNVYAAINGITYSSTRAQNIDIGTNSDLVTLDLGFVGPNTAVTKLAGNTVYVGSNFGFTDEIYIDSNNELRLDGTNINMTGSVNIQDTMTLAPQDPLPAGVLGELAVSSSNELYFNNGTAWSVIS